MYMYKKTEYIILLPLTDFLLLCEYKEKMNLVVIRMYKYHYLLCAHIRRFIIILLYLIAIFMLFLFQLHPAFHLKPHACVILKSWNFGF